MYFIEIVSARTGDKDNDVNKFGMYLFSDVSPNYLNLFDINLKTFLIYCLNCVSIMAVWNSYELKKTHYASY